MGLTKGVLRRPVTTILVILCLIVFGVSSLFGTKLELTPEMEMPMQVVFTVYPGANPEDVDSLVTNEIEEAASTLNSVKSITSYSNENTSMVLLQYEYGTDMDKSYSDLKKKMDSLQSSLPDDVQEPMIVEFNINEQPAMSLAVNNDGADNLYNYVDQRVVPELEKLPTVASVDISGGRQQYIKVELMQEKLTQYGLNMNSIVTAVASADLSYPAGTTEVGSQELNVTTGVSFKDAESLKKIPITLRSGATIYLEDVANIYTNLEDAAGIGRYNGRDAVTLGIKKQQKNSAGEVSKEVNRVINQLLAEDPELEIVVVNDTSESINGSLTTVFQTMIAAVIISMIIIMLFFGDVKASLIVGTSIPLSILAALIAMKAMGFSLNVLTLGGLVLGVGMMVDNSIVVLESCFRSTKGKGFSEFRQAALEGSGIVIQSIIGSTITTCVVFLPMALMEGMSGQLFKPLGFTIVFCMLASLVSAMTVVPLCYVMYRPQEKERSPLSGIVKKLQIWYRDTMKVLLPKKKTVMLTSVGLLVFSLFLATKVGMELMPSTEQRMVNITAELRPGLSVEKADEVLTAIENYIVQDEDLESYTISYGASGMSLSTGSSGSVTAYLKDDTKRSSKEVANDWRPYLTSLPNTNVTVEASDMMAMMGGGGSDSVEYILQSTQYDELKEASDRIVAELKERPEVRRIHSTLENSAPVVQIDVDPLKAAAEGLSAAQIGGTVNMMLSGAEATTLDVDGDEISVMVEYPDGEYERIDQVKSIVLPTPTGSYVALTDVADIYFKDSPQQIIRMDRQYQVTITGELASGSTIEEQMQIENMLYDEVVVPNINERITRAKNTMDENMIEEFTTLGTAILVAVFLVFVVMAAQFESPKFSIMVMTTIPFSLIGSFGLLFLCNVSLSMPSLLGFLMLVGTVVNNGILYVDTANQYRAEMDRDTALVEAGATRLRPILMTTLTTVLSMIPMALGIGDSGAMMQGLALVNVGGLLASTVLSLLMLPIYYTVMNRTRKNEYLDVD